MRILEIIHRFPPSTGGSQKVAHELSKEFVKKGHEVTVITSTSMDHLDTRGFSSGRPFSMHSNTYSKNKEEINGINVIRFEPDFQLFTYALNKKMKKFLKEHIVDYDVVHVHEYLSYEADIASRLCKKYSIPCILTAHDVISHHFGFYETFKKIYDFFIGKKILKNCDKLIALTPANVEQYNSVMDCSSKVEVIPNAIDPIKKGPKSKEILKNLGEFEKIILFVGRIVDYKGTQYIVEAMPDILKKYPKTKAVFVGPDQGFSTKLKEIAKKNGVENSCIITGKVPLIEDYYSFADVFVLPSKGEGFGLVAVEAMSLGIPAVLADLGGLKYVLKDIGGYPIDMSNEDKISSQISQHVLDIFDNKNIDKEMKFVVERIRDYTWDKIADKTLELFKHIKK